MRARVSEEKFTYALYNFLKNAKQRFLLRIINSNYYSEFLFQVFIFEEMAANNPPNPAHFSHESTENFFYRDNVSGERQRIRMRC